jgi:ribosomal protein S18 acetylase RimI-like enzyme
VNGKVARRFGRLSARAPGLEDEAFLAALYLACRPDLGALPVPGSVVAGIARHQQGQRDADYAQRYPAAQSWLLEQAGCPVGWVLLALVPGGVRVVDLAVDPRQRRRGVARAVLSSLQEKEEAILLRVRVNNGPARTMYTSLGFGLRQDQGDVLELAWKREPAN